MQQVCRREVTYNLPVGSFRIYGFLVSLNSTPNPTPRYLCLLSKGTHLGRHRNKHLLIGVKMRMYGFNFELGTGFGDKGRQGLSMVEGPRRKKAVLNFARTHTSARA